MEKYDRFAGITSLPGADGRMPRPFRVDEDGNVLYLDTELDAVGRLGKDDNVQLAEAPNSNWNGHETMRAQGQRDGRVLSDAYNHARSRVDAARAQSTARMTQATNDALSEVGGLGSTIDLTGEFSRVDRLPDFSQGSWKKVESKHAPQAFEHILPGESGMVIKIYLKDTDNGGRNTATITSPTDSVDHYLNFPAYKAGFPVNAENAEKYLKDRNGRRDIVR